MLSELLIGDPGICLVDSLVNECSRSSKSIDSYRGLFVYDCKRNIKMPFGETVAVVQEKSQDER